MSQHHLRIPDDLWAAASTRAMQQGETVATVVRRALADYVLDEPTPAVRDRKPQPLSAAQRRLVLSLAGGAVLDEQVVNPRTVARLRRQEILEEDGSLSAEGRRLARRLVARRVAIP